MDYCKTCIYYPPSSCDGKPCTQCDANNPFFNCYVNKEDYITKERMNERLAMMHKLYPDAKPTNADRIRSMTDEELAKSITDDLCDRVCHSPLSCDGNCETQVLAWLKQEYTP